MTRLHEPRTPEQALREVLATAPTPRLPAAPVVEQPEYEPTVDGPQDGPHLDQRLPARSRGARPMREAWQPLEATVDVGIGTVAARVSGTRLDDRTKAQFLRARLDAGNGAALHAELWQGDGDLFATTFVNDGVAPVRAEAELSGIDLFPHARYATRIGGIDVPVRVGVFTEWQHFDHQQADLTRRWLSIGPRLMFEPTLQLAAGKAGSLELFGRLGGDLGFTWFTDEYRSGIDRDTTLRYSGELGAGLRGRLGRLHAELGYRMVDTAFGPTSTSLLGERNRSELEREQFYVGFGITY